MTIATADLLAFDTRRKFHLGTVVATPAAAAKIADGLVTGTWEVLELLLRHQSGDWGIVPPEDAKANDDALVNGERLMSVYTLPNGQGPIWIITEADRSVTTVLLPEDY